jgi:hypothetical protein
MRDEDRGMRLDVGARATKTPTKPAAISWPFPVDGRLDQLVELANDVGAATRRNELTAALVAAATPDGEALMATVVAYRRASVGDLVLGVEEGADVIYLPRYGPGRRKPGADTA